LDPLKNLFLPSSAAAEKKLFFDKLKYYVYVYVEIDDDNHRYPIYIGKGRHERCFAHLENIDQNDSAKNKRIKRLLASKSLGIDILAHGLDEKTALKIEAACIDLMGIDNLTNEVRGHGKEIKRLSISDLFQIKMKNQDVEVLPEHRGVAILINRDYRPTFGDLELFEITRGIWPKKMMTFSKNCSAKYAYATYQGVVKDVYEIYDWVPAGTQEYFTRSLTKERLEKARWEFVGRRASFDIRNRYVGRVIRRERSYGDPFVKVGYDS
jgi:hypothetical protein